MEIELTARELLEYKRQWQRVSNNGCEWLIQMILNNYS